MNSIHNFGTDVSLPILPPKFDFVATASEALGIEPWVVRSPARYRSLVRVRWAIAHVMRDSYGRSLSEIGNALKKDHSSILYGIGKSRDLIKTDIRHAALVDMLVTVA